eukprot:6991895-Pyramimonas_sp.AAC.1
MFRGSIGSSTESPNGATRMRLPRPVQRSKALREASPKVPVAQSACVSLARYSVSWPYKGGSTEDDTYNC